jgi:tRNA(Ile)-lysidine synthetase-like protein
VNGLEAAVGAALARADIGPDATLLAAASGGADSTALLRALAGLDAGARPRLVACHVDHGIRPREENDADTAFVRRLCDLLGVPLIVKTVAPGACTERARVRGQGLEESARGLRHGLLEEAAREAGARAIALGHTRDDHVETVLMRVLQGSEAAGLRGIPFRRGPFVRPLLGCTRRQVVAYLESVGQDWREDPSNNDTRFLRNRIRRLILPFLERELPGASKGLLSLSRKAGLAAEALDLDASRLPWRAERRGFSISANAFLAAAPAVRAHSLLRLYDRIRPPGAPRRLPWRFLEPALALRDAPKASTVLQGYGTALFARQGRLFWIARLASRGKKGYFIEVSGACRHCFSQGSIRLTLDGVYGAGKAAKGGVFIRSAGMKPPLVLRSKRKGDRILIESGEIPVKDLLADWRVPPARRDDLPILADRDGVLAILGDALGFETRVRAGSLADESEAGPCVSIQVEHIQEEGREQQ